MLPIAVLLTLVVPNALWAAGPWVLREDLQGQSRLIRTEMKVDGTMRINPDGKKVRHYPMALTATYEAVERILSPTASIRYYRQAESQVKANDTELTDQLPTVKRLIAVTKGADGLVLFSPEFTLNREELDLVNISANPLILADLLPNDAVPLNQPWSPSNQVLAQLLGIDTVNSNDLTGTLTEVDASGIAKITFQGKVSGAIQGVATEIELKSRMNLDTGENRILWFATSIQEDRAIGHALPGFTVTAVIRTQLEPTDAIDELSDKQLAKFDLKVSEGRRMLAFQGKEAGFRIMHDRNWFALAETPKQTVFRRVLDGELIAQANVSRLTDLKPQEHMTIEAFQLEVEKALGDRLGQVTDATQSVNSQGLRELRVTAVGSANELPITWVYYMVSNDQGRRYSTVFTYETSLAEKFAEADRSFMSGFDLVNPPEPQTALRIKATAKPEEPVLKRATLESATQR